MEVFFNHAFPTFSELLSNLKYIEKNLEKEPRTKELSLIVLPDYLLDFSMLRISPYEAEILINTEIKDLLSRYKIYTELVHLVIRMIKSGNGYLEKKFFDIIKTLVYNYKDSDIDIDKIREESFLEKINKDSTIEIKSIYGFIKYSYLISKLIKKEGMEVINQLEFKYPDGLFYETLMMTANNLETQCYFNIYEKTTSLYIRKECELIKKFLLIISAHSNKLGEVYKYDIIKKRKRDFESFYQYSFSGLTNLSEEYETHKIDRIYDINPLIEFMCKIYNSYYNNGKDTTEIKSLIHQSKKYSLFLFNLLQSWIEGKDFNFIRDDIEQAKMNYYTMYDLALESIKTTFRSIYIKESLMTIREKLSLFLIASEEDSIDWERSIPKEIWESIETFYPDQFQNYIHDMLKYLTQLLFNLADNYNNVEPFSKKKIDEIEGFLSYCINLMEKKIDPSLFIELLEIKKKKMLVEYKKRLAIITEISRIPNYHDVNPEKFKKRLYEYFH
jgi:hypothetical protein